ncbi:NAD(P)-binding protein [Atractiella rhizophila]|nr:NAD(P)-binding protein [Atractiella rhizophila]
MPGKYANCCAIVTGAASGIGLELSKNLISHGCYVVLCDLNATLGESVVSSLPSALSTFYQADITAYSSLRAVFAHAISVSPTRRVDFVFANAGISELRELPPSFSDPTLPSVAVKENTKETRDTRQFAFNSLDPAREGAEPDLKVVDVNLNGVLKTVHCALETFRKQEVEGDGWRGKIVVTASNASIYPFPADVLYATAKHGVLGLVRSLGPCILPERITINCVAPSVVPTALAPPGFVERLANEGRITSHETMWRAFDALIDPKTSITGHLLENHGEDNTIRPHLEYADDKVRMNMGEFWTGGVEDITVCERLEEKEGWRVLR